MARDVRTIAARIPGRLHSMSSETTRFPNPEKRSAERGRAHRRARSGAKPMSYDVAFRHRQALDPSGLDSIAACLHAIQAAAKDCRNAGKPFETDPAVLLLARHLGQVATEKMPDRAALRSLCADAIADLARRPVLATLALRGVGHDDAAKRLFHSEARKALRRLADALGLEPGRYDLRVCAGGPAVSGEVILHGEQLYVQVSLSGYGPNQLLYRRVRDRRDYSGLRNHWATMRELLDPVAFAAKIAADLGIDVRSDAEPRLVA